LRLNQSYIWIAFLFFIFIFFSFHPWKPPLDCTTAINPNSQLLATARSKGTSVWVKINFTIFFYFLFFYFLPFLFLNASSKRIWRMGGAVFQYIGIMDEVEYVHIHKALRQQWHSCAPNNQKNISHAHLL
jgi:hypothetical protein